MSEIKKKYIVRITLWSVVAKVYGAVMEAKLRENVETTITRSTKRVYKGAIHLGPYIFN